MTDTTAKPWLASYPPGVPAEIDADAYQSLPEVLAEAFDRYAARPAFSNMGHTLTYGDLAAQSAAFGAWLQREAGLRPGDRLAIMLPNVLQYPVALCGALRAGVTVVNVNPLYTAPELRQQLADSGARAIVILENFAHTLERVIHDTAVEIIVTTRIGDVLPPPRRWLVNAVVAHVKRMVPRWQLPAAVPWSRVLADGARRDLVEARPAASDVAFLQYTGGTTGTAKGAMLTHRNMIANLQQAEAWLGGHVRRGEEVIVTALPLYHIFSLLANCLTFMKFGGENLLITNPRDMKGFVRTLSGRRFTAITGVNTLFNGLLNAPGFAQLDFSALHITLGGGMAVQRSVAERWQTVTGTTLLEAYGLTETAPAVCINPVDLAAYNGSIGLPVPSTEVGIRDDDGTELPPGAIGELCVRGPQVTPGYWNRPEETQAAFFPGGWFRTGDMARIDDAGYVYIVDRKKDMVVVSGFNVYPNEVEDVIAQHPGVLEAAVVGVPDPVQGERVKAFVVARDPALTAVSVIEHCRTSLTRYKIPQEIEFRDQLPKSNVGKILRRELRDEAARDAASRAA